MLFRAVLLDSAIEPIPGKEELIYNSLYRLLRDILKYGVILIDEGEEVIQGFKSAIDKWENLDGFPEGPQAKIDLYKLFGLIIKENRLVKVAAKEIKTQCDSQLCICLLGIALYNDPDFFFANQECFPCVVNNISSSGKTQAIKIEVYDRNIKVQQFLSIRGFEIKPKQWSQRDFEDRVLIPLFLTTENVKLFDKQMGKYFSSNSGYRNTVKWLIEVFDKYSIYSSDRIFELYVGTINDLEDRRALRKFEKEIKQQYSAKLNFNIHWSSHYSHDRFLETDQVRLAIGHGFDLIENKLESYPCTLRDTTISYIDDLEII